MRRARRIAALLTCGALGAALALGAGCARTPKKTAIVFWQSRPAAVLAPLLRRFEAEHPGFVVELRQLTPEQLRDSLAGALTSGNVPDLFECPSPLLPSLVAGAVLADWSAGVADLRDSVRGWEQCSRGETIYGLPWVIEPRVLFFNRSLLARAGLDGARAPETWDDLARDAAAIERLARRAHLRDVHGLGFAAAGSGGQFDDFMPLAWGRGGGILSTDLDSSLFDSPENRAALVYYLSLRKSVASESPDDLERDFAAGRLGLLCADGALATRLPARGFELGVARIPRWAGEGGRHAAVARGGVLASFRGSREKEAALRLARFLLAPECAEAIASADALPARIEADSVMAARGNPIVRALLRPLEDVRFPPNHAEWDSMRLAIEDGLALAWRDSLAPPESAAARASAAVDRRLAQLLGGH